MDQILDIHSTLYTWQELHMLNALRQVWNTISWDNVMMTSSNGNIFRVTGPWCGNSPVTCEFPSQRPVTRALIFSLICAWINVWVNNHEAGDLRRHRAHYGVIVMVKYKEINTNFKAIMYLFIFTHHKLHSSDGNKTQLSRDLYGATDSMWLYNRLRYITTEKYDNGKGWSGVHDTIGSHLDKCKVHVMCTFHFILVMKKICPWCMACTHLMRDVVTK